MFSQGEVFLPTPKLYDVTVGKEVLDPLVKNRVCVFPSDISREAEEWVEGTTFVGFQPPPEAFAPSAKEAHAKRVADSRAEYEARQSSS